MHLKTTQELSDKQAQILADLHLKLLPESFLNNFGKKFLEICYKNLAVDQNNIIILAKDRNKTVGFLAGTMKSSSLFKSAISKNFSALCREILKTVNQRPVLIIRILSSITPIIFAKDRGPEAELQFIAIRPEYQGKGIGTKLVEQYKSILRNRGSNCFKVGTKVENKLSNGFYKKLGYKMIFSKTVFGDKLNYYTNSRNQTLVKQKKNPYLKPLVTFSLNTAGIFVYFLVINLILNRQLVWEIIAGIGSRNRYFGGDGVSYLYFAERFYQNLIHFKNPFSYLTDILYPFGTATATQDLGFIHGLYFVILRPFFTPYVSLAVSLIISIYLAEIFTYLLLRHLKISRYISFIFSLCFAFSPFMVWRLSGHFSYIHFFLFPLTVLLILKIYDKLTSPKNKLIYSALLGISVALLAYSTFYYFFMFAMFVIFYMLLYAVFNVLMLHKHIFNLFKNLGYFLTAFLVFFVTIFPMFLEVLKSLRLEDFSQPTGWMGADLYSGKLSSIFALSHFNPFFGSWAEANMGHMLSKEGLIYPGLLTFIGIYCYFKSPGKRFLLPLIFTNLIFYLLSLGPFMIIYTSFRLYVPDWLFFWHFALLDSKITEFYLPYSWLADVPFVSMMRSPIRYATPFVFGVIIAAAISVHKYVSKNPSTKKFLFPILLAIFFLDQTYVVPLAPKEPKMPVSSYEYIKRDPLNSSVLEIPFVIRDGLYYWGGIDALNLELGQLIHQKPVIGGYLGRINNYKVKYFENNPVTGYFGPLIDRPDRAVFSELTYGEMEQALDFLDTRYILVNNSLETAPGIKEDLEVLEYEEIFPDDNGYALFEKRGLPGFEYNEVKINSQTPAMFLFGDWYKDEYDNVFVKGRHAGVFLKTKVNQAPGKISLNAYSSKDLEIDVFINRKKEASLKIDSYPKLYEFTSLNTVGGLNRVDIVTKGGKQSRFHISSISAKN